MTLHTLRWANPLNKLNGVQFSTTCFIFMGNLLTKIPWRIKFLLWIWGGKKAVSSPARQDSRTSETWNSALWREQQSCDQGYQCFLQLVVCNCVTVRDQEYFSPCPGRGCQVFPHWRGNPAGCGWWTPWKSCWSSNIQKLHSTRNPSTDRELCQQHQRSVSK